MVMTMPDLHQYQVKRSKFPVHYVYIQHSMVSCHMVYRPGAFDHFDTIFCSGPHHKLEIRALEKARNLQEKSLVVHGYGRLDSIMSSAQSSLPTDGGPLHVLIAPSWGEKALIETVGAEVLSQLLGGGYKITLRPHPQTVKFSKHLLNRFANQYRNHPNFNLELDISDKTSLHDSDVMISDWSGAAIDYSFGLEKPVIFIDVPRKINNPAYKDLNIEPFEDVIRSKIGTIVSPNKIYTLSTVVEGIVSDPSKKIDFKALKEKYLYNPLQSAQVGATELDILCRNLRRKHAA